MKRKYFSVTCARSANAGASSFQSITSSAGIFEWAEITLIIEREFNFNDADQRRDLLTSLESARNLFFGEKAKE